LREWIKGLDGTDEMESRYWIDGHFN